MKHSYKINEKPLKCWVAIHTDGLVLTGHCECMAGLAEVCSHVGAVLFLVENWGRISQKLQQPVSLTTSQVLC